MLQLLGGNRRSALLCGCLLLLALHQLSAAAVIKMKAGLAQVLIARAWQTSLATGSAVKPWPWADTWPVLRLSVPVANVDLLVLRGTRGNALAFGPGHESVSALPGQPGVAVIGGHRDTHFNFLGQLAEGDGLSLQRADGSVIDYRVSALRVVDSAVAGLPLGDHTNALLLVTCYPLDALHPGGSLRYVVVAEPRLSTPVLDRFTTSSLVPLSPGGYRL